MSVFDFPRINIKGLIQVNVGTGNNDDYSLQNAGAGKYTGYTTPAPAGQFGQSIRVGNSATVQPYVFNDPNTGKPMNDDQMVTWMQNSQNVLRYPSPGSATPVPDRLIPGEWNYFGNMGLNMMNTSVVGVTVPSAGAPNGVQVYTANDPFGLIGGDLSFNNRPDNTGRSTAMLIDVNPEAPPASQVFTENLMLKQGNTVIFNAKPSKAITRWINFQRNTYLYGPNGAAGTFQCVIPLSELQGQPIVAILQKYAVPGKTLAGLVFRYTMFRSLQKINTFKYNEDQWLAAITDLYQNQGENPTYVQVSGTIGPWYDGEMQSMTTGHYLVPAGSFPSPGGNQAPDGTFQLGPALVNEAPGNPLISIDLTAALPDNYTDRTNYDPLLQNTNPKYNLGPLYFGQRLGASFFPIGPVNYLDTAAGDAAGWIFDYKIPANLAAAPATDGPENTDIIWPLYTIASNQSGQDLLQEQRLSFVSDQSGIFAEQGLTPASPGWQSMPPLPTPANTFSSQGYMDTQASFNAFAWGKPDNSPVYDLWMWNQTYVNPPASGPLPVRLLSGYRPGDPISVPVDQAGVFILTITETGYSASDIAANFNMMTWPMINCRILPNQEYSNLYTFNAQGQPVATEAMDWNALYNNVFRNYYILYPGMSKILPLNDPNQWIGPTLFNLLDRVDPTAWNTMSNMPRTRDLSATRRWLVQAYCQKFATLSPPANVTQTAAVPA